uniref:Uncharacterized protein n=1 Tax=Rhizophora mucronata TaxID=61149 RepID=A0A2P2IHP7_RHIMU
MKLRIATGWRPELKILTPT